MRKVLETVSLGALAVLAWVTIRALTGPERLPGRVPTHFDISGHPNAWGPAGMFLVLPGVAVILYVLMTWVSRYPSAFNFPVRVTRENRLRLEAVALGMTAWIKAEMMCLFAGIQVVTIGSARSGHGTLPPLLMPLSIGVIFGTIIGHFIAMRREAGFRPTGNP